jgi:hypothetical protein
MDTKKVVLIGGAGVGAYLLYRFYRDQRALAEAVAAAGASGADVPSPPTVIVPASPAVTPTQEQATSPAYWESVARSVVAELGLGALPPWPGIGPWPRAPIGPVYSLTAYR